MSLSGLALQANTVCQVSLNVTATAPGFKDNGVTVTSDAGTGNTSHAFLQVLALPPAISVALGSSSVALAASTSLSFTITNPNPSTTQTGIAFEEALPGGLVIATPNGLNGSCGRGSPRPRDRGWSAWQVRRSRPAPAARSRSGFTATGLGDQINITWRPSASESSFRVSGASASPDVLGATSRGQLYAFGEDEDGQLGHAPGTSCDPPGPTPTLVRLPGATGPPVQVAAGESHSLALTTTGELYTFGDNYYGQLGRTTNSGTTTPNPKPARVTLPGATGRVAQIAAGGSHSLALTTTGQLYAFGDNYNGELGNATNTNTGKPHPTPQLVTLPGATGRVARVAASEGDTLALTTTGQLYAFGNNALGELGPATKAGTNNPNPTPTRVNLPPGTTVESISSGSAASHSLVVLSDPSVRTSSLPAGRVGVRYSAALGASGGLAPYAWSASGLGRWLSITGPTGVLSGVPRTASRQAPRRPFTSP